MTNEKSIMIFRQLLWLLWYSDDYFGYCGIQTTLITMGFRQLLWLLWYSDDYFDYYGIQTTTLITMVLRWLLWLLIHLTDQQFILKQLFIDVANQKVLDIDLYIFYCFLSITLKLHYIANFGIKQIYSGISFNELY